MFKNLKLSSTKEPCLVLVWNKLKELNPGSHVLNILGPIFTVRVIARLGNKATTVTRREPGFSMSNDDDTWYKEHLVNLSSQL
jgi:hypothetical protein